MIYVMYIIDLRFLVVGRRSATTEVAKSCSVSKVRRIRGMSRPRGLSARFGGGGTVTFQSLQICPPPPSMAILLGPSARLGTTVEEKDLSCRMFLFSDSMIMISERAVRRTVIHSATLQIAPCSFVVLRRDPSSLLDGNKKMGMTEAEEEEGGHFGAQARDQRR